MLRGVDLQIPQGDFLALMGPSGSGKTTLLNLMGGLDTPTEGSIAVAGDRIDSLSGSRLARWRARHIGFVFQLYHLLPVLTAERNVELPLLLTPLGRADRRHHVATAIDGGRPPGPREALPATALGRAGAAGGHRARHRDGPDAACSATSRRATSTGRRATRSSTCCRR